MSIGELDSCVLASCVPQTWSQAIVQWATETFGPVTPEAALDRAALEWNELTDPDRAPTPEEAADVVICLAAHVAAAGGDLAAEVERKMAINRARAWVSNGDGTGRHV